MEEKDRIEIERLIQLKAVTQSDKESALDIYKRLVTPFSRFCLKCPTSVRMLFKNLAVYYAKTKLELELKEKTQSKSK
jgi:hypothetical protein